jgi:acetylornithine/succinyldiaminopimelate/putrescine aminotransferase
MTVNPELLAAIVVVAVEVVTVIVEPVSADGGATTPPQVSLTTPTLMPSAA